MAPQDHAKDAVKGPAKAALPEPVKLNDQADDQGTQQQSETQSAVEPQ
jgi:hypothetical protein